MPGKKPVLAGFIALGALVTTVCLAGQPFEPVQALDAACQRPLWAGQLPASASASDAEFAEARLTVQAFNIEVENYANCLEQAERAIVAEQELSQEAISALATARADRNDAAVDAIMGVAGEFNRLLRERRAAEERSKAKWTEPPSLAGGLSSFALSQCFPEEMPDNWDEARIVVVVDVATDGKGTVASYPDALPRELRDGADCVLRRLEFRPATKDGVPVQAQVSLPIDFSQWQTHRKGVERIAPVMSSTVEELLALRERCAPAEAGLDGEVLMEVTIDTDGAVKRSRSVQAGATDAAVRAAQCILEGSRFRPGTRDGRPNVWTVRYTVSLASGKSGE